MIRVEQPNRTKEVKRAKKLAEQLAEQERIQAARKEKSKFKRLLKL